MSNGAILNPEVIQALRDLSPDGDGEFLRELITIFLTDTPKQLAQLEEALANQDATTAIRSAHTIKGSSGNFGAEILADLARQIEAEAKAGNLAAAVLLMPQIRQSFGQVAAALERLASN